MAGAKFTPVPGLNEIVAAMCVPAVQDAAEEVARRARAHAPATKTWVSERDDDVRPTHVKADEDAEVVPVNLRIKVRSMDWDREHRGLGEWTYMLFPKDESSRAVVNLRHCRCHLAFDENGVARYVKVTQARAEGAKASALVYAEGHLVREAEYGDVYPFGNHSDGAFFMGRAAAEVQAMIA